MVLTKVMFSVQNDNIIKKGEGEKKKKVRAMTAEAYDSQ